MTNGQEIITWVSIGGMALTSRMHYDDLMRARVKSNGPYICILFMPHDIDVPDYFNKFHFREVVSTTLGRYYLAECLKETSDEAQPCG